MTQEQPPNPSKEEVDRYVAGLEEQIGVELDEKAGVNPEKRQVSERYKQETIAKMRRDGWDLLYNGPKDMKINPIPFTEQMIFEVDDGTKLAFKRSIERGELK